jgi:hypothetical protein|tara:strand:+ start:10102 stop:11304 length:1203 start_codon:yes stop_codon:yes gene_type:complete
MSSLLGEAIVDAKALRTSALKNAESTIIEKYSDEVKKTLEQLLEQEEEAMDMPPAETMDAPPDLASLPEEPMDETTPATPVTEDDIPFAATDGLAENDGHNLSDLPGHGEDIEITIDLGALQESIEALAGSLDEDIDIELSEAKPDFLDLDDDGDTKEPMKGASATKEETNEELDVTVDDEADEEEADSKAMAGLANLDEDSINTEDIIDAVMEKLNVDTGFELSGWAGRPTSQLKLGQQRAWAGAASTPTETTDEEAELDPELELNESITELEDENNSLKAQLDKYKHAIGEIKENLYEVNLSNARLLYTNRVLRNSSLNERQKDKIVEAISTAGSVTEAKTIFDTLQSTVEAKPVRQSPQSLSEAIGRRSSVIRATRQESSQPNDPFSDRMRRLAGIK